MIGHQIQIWVHVIQSKLPGEPKLGPINPITSAILSPILTPPHLFVKKRHSSLPSSPHKGNTPHHHDLHLVFCLLLIVHSRSLRLQPCRSR